MRWLLVASLLWCAPVVAQTRAWLDRDRIALDETATLRVETQADAAPDYAPLLASFDLDSHSSRQQVTLANGRLQSRTTYSVALRPRRAGRLDVPSLRVGGTRTAPLTLLVTAASAPRLPLAGGRDVFIVSEADSAAPYVQQSVGWVVRLYSATPLVSGRLDQEAPAGASLQRVGDDVQYRREVDGRTYQVVERRYLLVPERSGALAIPPATFEGRGIGGVLDRWFGDGQEALQARAAPRVLRVRGIPPDAPEPWLPLRALTLRVLQAPRALQAGRAGSVTLELQADGATRSQVPALVFAAPSGTQVFPEAPQVDESRVDGLPRLRVVQRFSIVPGAAGPLQLVGPRVAWWDVGSHRARVAAITPLRFDVAPGVAASVDPVPADAPTPAPRAKGIAPWWWLAALAPLALWAAWRHFASRRTAAVRRVAEAPAASPPSAPGIAEALATGDLARIDTALRATTGAATLDALAAGLQDDDQRAAVHALQAARWAGGDSAAAIARLRAAFARPPRLRSGAAVDPDPLPPLYPGS